jgi:hypothetical protein
MVILFFFLIILFTERIRTIRSKNKFTNLKYEDIQAWYEKFIKN